MTTESERLHRVEMSYKHTRNVILAVLGVSILFQAWIFWVVSGPERPADALVEFASAGATGAAILCPGDTLLYSVTIDVQEAGVFDLDVSVWRITPPGTAIFSQTRRFIASDAQTYTISREWTVPDTHIDPNTNQMVEWSPGDYERRHAITAINQSAEPSIAVIPFSIGEDCP